MQFPDNPALSFQLSGNRRLEEIHLFLNDQEIDSPEDPGLLSMDASMKIPNMYLLDCLSKHQTTNEANLLHIGTIRHYDNAQKNKEAKAHVVRILSDIFQQKTLPKIITANLLTNDKHWQLVIIDLHKGINSPILKVINTTNMIRQMTLDDIQTAYYKAIGHTLNECLKKRDAKLISKNDIQYMQGLQYGNMGCGFATNKNYERFLLQEFQPKHTFTHDDAIITDEIKEVIIDGTSFSFPGAIQNSNSAKAKSIRNSKEEEVFKRLSLFSKLRTQKQLKLDLEKRQVAV